MKKVAIIGMGKSGQSCALLLKQKNIAVVGFDQNRIPYEGIEVLSDQEPVDVHQFDYAVLSPGIPDENLIVQSFKRGGIEIISEIELAFRHLPKNKILIGITGTNGKTTTTHMITHALNFFGIKAHAVGNVGRPLTDALDEEGVLVIELSSFQLEKTFSPSLDVAVLLRITPDHLDRYPDFVHYAEAKAKIAMLLKTNGLLTVHKDTSRLFPDLFDLHHPFLFGYGDLSENVQATIGALSYFGKTALEVQKALATFKAPPHRIEWIRELNGVNYYNDSKATNIDSVLFALKSIKGPIHLIAGGKHKGSPYTSWKPLLKEKGAKVYLIGEAAEQIAKDLKGSISLEACNVLEEALRKASQAAEPGSTVLLSPGCSSYDQFKNYEDRGFRFKQLVEQLEFD